MNGDELISGECPWMTTTDGLRDIDKPLFASMADLLRDDRWHKMTAVRWRWLDIGGGGPVMPAEPGTALAAEDDAAL